MKPTISIIITCYNSARYLGRCLDSVSVSIASYPVEVLLIDDGSTDGTDGIMEKYHDSDSRFLVYRKSNGGYCSGIRYGLERASGEYVMMLGSDDEISDGLIEDLFRQILSDDPDIVVFRSVLYSEATSQLIHDRWTSFERPITLTGAVYDFDAKYSEWTKTLFKRDTSKLFKTSLARRAHYYGRYGIYSDDVFAVEIALQGNKFAFITTVGYIIHVRPGSLSYSTYQSKSPQFTDQMMVLSEFLKSCNQLPKIARKRIARAPNLIRFGEAWCGHAICLMKERPSEKELKQSLMKLWQESRRKVGFRVSWKYRVILSWPTFFIPLVARHNKSKSGNSTIS